MSEKKSWGSTVLGWFVERDKEGTPESSVDPEEAVAEQGAAPPPAAAGSVQLAGDVPLPEAGGGIDFAAVYRAAKIGAEEQGRIEKALALLRTLPAEAPTEVKRQIVEASLKAFGYPVEQIIQAGVAEISALQAFIEFSQRSTQKIVGESNFRIEALQKEIADLRALIEQKASAQQTLTHQCNQQKLHIQEVLEFFGQEAVARIVRDSPPPPAAPAS